MGISRGQRCGKQPSRKADLPQALGDRRPQASREKKMGAHHRRTPSSTCAAAVLRPGLTFFLDTMQSGYRFPLHSVDLRPEVCAAFLDFAGRRQMG
jgi:hypothetical protein